MTIQEIELEIANLKTTHSTFIEWLEYKRDQRRREDLKLKLFMTKLRGSLIFDTHLTQLNNVMWRLITEELKN